VKIRSVRHNNRKKIFEVGTSTKALVFPFSKASPTPTTEDPSVDTQIPQLIDTSNPAIN
jgi:hypothetical protein